MCEDKYFHCLSTLIWNWSWTSYCCGRTPGILCLTRWSPGNECWWCYKVQQQVLEPPIHSRLRAETRDWGPDLPTPAGWHRCCSSYPTILSVFECTRSFWTLGQDCQTYNHQAKCRHGGAMVQPNRREYISVNPEYHQHLEHYIFVTYKLN